jgi:hypothetical protein
MGKSYVTPDDHLDVKYDFKTYKEATDKYLELVLSRSEFRTLIEGQDVLAMSHLGEEHGLVKILKTMVINAI